MRNKSLLLLLTAILFACSEKSLELTEIDGVPDRIRGCSCIFARSAEDFQNNKFVYINTQDVSVLSVDGELIYWNPQVELEPPFTIITTYDKENRVAKELTELEGSIIVTSRDGLTATLKVFGRCGC